MMNTIKNIATYAVLTGVAAVFHIQSAMAAIAIEHWTQANGAEVFLVQSHAIPMVDVQIDFDAGGRRDPPDQAGLAQVTASLSGMGVLADASKNEAALDENALGEAWADLGANFGAHSSSDRMSFALRSLTYPDLLSKVMTLAARQLAAPAFAPEIWQRERETLSAAIKEANTRPATLAEHAFEHAVFGQHPYGYEMTEASLKRIEVSHMATLYRQLILPCRARVSVVGALTRSQADALVEQLLSRLPDASAGLAGLATCPTLPPVAEVAALTEAKDITIEFDSAQAHVLIGQPGYKRNDPDFFAMMVGNYILGGGGFVSRLTTEVREKRGLSYSVDSRFSPGLHAGEFTIGLQTRPDQAHAALQVSREVLANFVANGPTEEELVAAKKNLLGGFALRLDSNKKLSDNLTNIAWNRLPLNYLDTWTQQVDRVTVNDIKAAFARKLQPNKMVTVVLGAKLR